MGRARTTGSTENRWPPPATNEADIVAETIVTFLVLDTIDLEEAALLLHSSEVG